MIHSDEHVGAILHHVDDRIGLASCGAVYISLLRKPLDNNGAASLHRVAREMSHRLGNKHVSLAVIEPGAAGAPSAEVRESMAKLAKQYPILAAGIVLEGSGFGPAAIRTLIAGMYLVTKKVYPHKIFESAGSAATWLVPLLGQAGVTQSAAEITAAVEETRRAIK
jgi:hypothetical protein